jgi:hypothetical protein
MGGDAFVDAIEAGAQRPAAEKGSEARSVNGLILSATEAKARLS